MTTIDDFHGDYYFLSNFYPSQVEYEGLIYSSVEHAFQAAKTHDQDFREVIRVLKTPALAKKAGRILPIRSDWEAVKCGVMEELVRRKFTTHKSLASRLIATGDAQLIEGNWWGDKFWGVCKGVGENHLGKILMEVRAELCV